MIEVKPLPVPKDLQSIRRALLSVFDKSGIAEFAGGLHSRGIELVSTGGTARAIRDAGIPVTDVSDITGFPEILGGRVKTLHPKVHGALLARRNDPEDIEQLQGLDVAPIDLVVVNLYPFQKATGSADVTDAVAIENIDIGGPTMLRAAAKNFFFVGVVTDPADYSEVLDELDRNEGCLSMTTRRRLATAAFEHTAAYDGAVYSYFTKPAANGTARHEAALKVAQPLAQQLRYGENPHQNAELYGSPAAFYEQLHGKELSYNNILDLSAALHIITEFESHDPTVAILKHTNPCGVATSATLAEAYEKAFATDRQSPFGGIVVVNQTLDLETASAIDKVFTEIIIAPEFDDDVLGFLKQKKNRRLIRIITSARHDMARDVRSVVGGSLVQDQDPSLPSPDAFMNDLKVVTNRKPTVRELLDLDFAWRVVKWVKSNAIVYARDRATLGIGAGQMSRIDSSEIAVAKGKKSELDFSGCVVASDAFFPFADGVEEAARAGASAVIQPGGSIRDEEVIAAADNHGMAMVFTGRRHFRH
ncbi:MAG: bifunctional phosphoribosylaminoimidazolecarboxamide formyltransferase/IMP cyclohydrolase [Rhodothermia bacterium]|nr:bifunctional phosphoribosylaminoimidazolecarboxamide formyltransferase/IMP cyclohydrolase [Rhodothermia bacterium]